MKTINGSQTIGNAILPNVVGIDTECGMTLALNQKERRNLLCLN